MFNHEGPARSPQKNRRLAGFLALVAGFVNSAGFVLLGSFTSHVTGSAGRLATDVVARDAPAAVSAFLLILTFWLGAFSASSMLHTGFFPRRSAAYAAALFSEATLLIAFVALNEESLVDVSLVSMISRSPRHADAYAGLLCFAMGMQNSLVTYITGARVRTTHITGVVTDLGIEAARWWRWYRVRFAEKSGLPLVVGRTGQEAPPDVHTFNLLLTIFWCFVIGAVGGAEVASQIGSRALVIPGAAAFLASFYAFRSGRGPVPASGGGA